MTEQKMPLSVPESPKNYTKETQPSIDSLVENIPFAEDEISQSVREQMIFVLKDSTNGSLYREKIIENQNFFLQNTQDPTGLDERFQAIVKEVQEKILERDRKVSESIKQEAEKEKQEAVKETTEIKQEAVKETTEIKQEAVKETKATTKNRTEQNEKLLERQRQLLWEAYSAFGSKQDFETAIGQEKANTWKNEAKKLLGQKYVPWNSQSEANLETIVLASHRSEVLKAAPQNRQAELSKTLSWIQEVASQLWLPYHFEIFKAPQIPQSSAKDIIEKLGVSHDTPLERRGNVIIARSSDGKSDVAFDLSNNRRMAVLSNFSAQSQEIVRNAERDAQIEKLETESAPLKAKFEHTKKEVLENSLFLMKDFPRISSENLDIARPDLIKWVQSQIVTELENRFKDPNLSGEDRKILERYGKPLKENIDQLLLQAQSYVPLQLKLVALKKEQEESLEIQKKLVREADESVRSNIRYFLHLWFDVFSQAELDEFILSANGNRAARNVGERDVHLSQRFDEWDKKVIMAEFQYRFSKAISEEEFKGCFDTDWRIKGFYGNTDKSVANFLREKFEIAYGVPPKFPIAEAGKANVEAEKVVGK